MYMYIYNHWLIIIITHPSHAIISSHVTKSPIMRQSLKPIEKIIENNGGTHWKPLKVIEGIIEKSLPKVIETYWKSSTTIRKQLKTVEEVFESIGEVIENQWENIWNSLRKSLDITGAAIENHWNNHLNIIAIYIIVI